ncbi:MAG: transposase [Myxococcota bacterium]|jgi:transposase
MGALADGVWGTALRMDEVAEGGVYGPGLYAKVVTDKCLYAMPLRRQERAFRDLGAPIPVSSLCTMFHRAAGLVSPLYEALLHHVCNAPYVYADETPMPVLDEDQVRRGWMWVFATDDALLFTHSPSRGKSTPERVLGQSMGTLIVDGYTAYNSVTGELGRARGGCWSHARRGLYEAQAQDPKAAKRWLDAIGELFYIERVAKDDAILASATHRERRETQSAPILKTLFAELDTWSEAAVDHSNALYKAVQYVRNQRLPLQLFVTGPAIPIHNNLSERALRAVALLRKNSLFAGHNKAAENYGMLLSLLATCCMHDVDPYAWLADVLIAVQESRSGLTAEDLLPWNWKRDRAKIAKPLFDLAG